MKITYEQMQPRDSVWLRTTVDKNGDWSIIIGQVGDVSDQQVWLTECTAYAYRLSRSLSERKIKNAFWDKDQIDTVYTLGS